jgi:hypothetical protein
MSTGLVTADGSFQIDPAGTAKLAAIKGPLAVVACHDNASSVLEQVKIFGEPDGIFSTDVSPGIRLWVSPIKQAGITVVLFDAQCSGEWASQTSALVSLVSSSLLYGGALDDSAFASAAWVTGLPQHLTSEENGEIGDGRNLHTSIGKLWWLLQEEVPAPHKTAKKYLDHALSQESGGEQANATRLYMRTLFPDAECVCVAGGQHEELQKKLLPNLKPKALSGVNLDGKMLGNLVRVCVEVLNDKKPVVIPEVWARVKHEQAEAALHEVLRSYPLMVGACFDEYDHSSTIAAFVMEMAEFEAEVARVAAEEKEAGGGGAAEEAKQKGAGRNNFVPDGAKGGRSAGRFEFWRRRKQKATSIRGQFEDQQVAARGRLKSVASLAELVPASAGGRSSFTAGPSMGAGGGADGGEEQRLVLPVPASQVEKVHARWLREAEAQLLQTLGGGGSGDSGGSGGGGGGSAVGGIVTDPLAQMELRTRLGRAIAVHQGQEALRERNERAAAQYCSSLLQHLHMMVLTAAPASNEGEVGSENEAVTVMGTSADLARALEAPEEGGDAQDMLHQLETKVPSVTTSIHSSESAVNEVGGGEEGAGEGVGEGVGEGAGEGSGEDVYKVLVPRIQVREGLAMDSDKRCVLKEGETFVVQEEQELQGAGGAGETIIRLRLQGGGWTSLTSSSNTGKALVQRINSAAETAAAAAPASTSVSSSLFAPAPADQQLLQGMQVYSGGQFKKGARKPMPESRRESKDKRGSFIDLDDSMKSMGKTDESQDGLLQSVARPQGLSITSIPEATVGTNSYGSTLGETHAKMEEDGGFKMKSTMQRLADMEAEESRILQAGAGAARAIHITGAPSTKLVRLAGTIAAYVAEVSGVHIGGAYRGCIQHCVVVLFRCNLPSSASTKITSSNA